MAEASLTEDFTSLTEEIDELKIEYYKIIKTSKGKYAVLYDGYYHNNT